MSSALLSLALFVAAAQSDKKDAAWLTNYKDAVALAAKEGKPLVIDAGRAG
jgi:hypothetical protein